MTAKGPHACTVAVAVASPPDVQREVAARVRQACGMSFSSNNRPDTTCALGPQRYSHLMTTTQINSGLTVVQGRATMIVTLVDGKWHVNPALSPANGRARTNECDSYEAAVAVAARRAA